MTDQSKPVPSGRARRFGKIVRLAGGVAKGALTEGVQQWRAGNILRASDLILTPANARRLTRQLAEMRGAAMKLGQILSMDGGDFLPKELAEILAVLRESAFVMPESQLESVLLANYGKHWPARFAHFERKPFAAASIGQVHRVETLDGIAAVVKIQYPGIADSIDSDVDNVSSLLRITGLIPNQIDLKPILQQVKAQLHEEANYAQEAQYLQAFIDVLGDDERFKIPRCIADLSTRNILAMTYVRGGPIEAARLEDQEERDRVMSLLIELLLVELFDMHLVQTDPNFANYRYDQDTGQVVLLDFGACRRFDVGFMDAYRELLAAVVNEDDDALVMAAENVGYRLGPEGSRYRMILLELFSIALEPIKHQGLYDFGQSNMGERLAVLGEEIREHKAFWEAPPVDAAYIHRKIVGFYMLATRLEARVPVRELLLPWL